MFDRTRKNIGYRFDAAMGMPRETSQIVLGYVIPKVIQQ
jgi:hypothetical protein